MIKIGNSIHGIWVNCMFNVYSDVVLEEDLHSLSVAKEKLIIYACQRQVGSPQGMSQVRKWLTNVNYVYPTDYHKIPKFSDARKLAVIVLKLKKRGFTIK